MWYFLLFLLFLYIWWQWRKLRRSIFMPHGDEMPPYGRRQSNRRGEEYTETGERKKYTSDEGEYADFEEVSGGTVTEETASTEAASSWQGFEGSRPLAATMRASASEFPGIAATP